MTKEEKQVYRQLRKYFGVDRWDSITMFVMTTIIIGSHWSDSIMFWEWTLSIVMAVVALFMIIYNFTRGKKAKAVLKWKSYEAEVVEVENFRTRFNQQRFDAVCQFTDAFGRVHTVTEENVRIDLYSKLFRPAGEVKVDYVAKAFQNPEAPDQIHVVVTGTGKFVQTGLFE